MKYNIIYSVFFTSIFQLNLSAQTDSAVQLYSRCFDSLQVLVKDNDNTSFKKAVFLTENVYTGNQMEYERFDAHIHQLAKIALVWMQTNPLKDYLYKDSINFHKNYSIFKLLKDTIFFKDPNGKTYQMLPYGYDFTDFFGREDWGYMFVSKLLATRKGNCHSLPYLYKILADELGATCWLGLAPNHIYIKNRCRKIGWYNTELTSGTFPIDAWLTASGYIPLQAIQNGIYMDTLSNQQAIALCVLDLAKGYEFQTKNYYDGFILKCCDWVLQYHPVNVQAMLLKAETLKRIYEKLQSEKNTDVAIIYGEMENIYIRLYELGYREMPEEMYLKWLKSVASQQENNGIKSAIAPKK